MKSGQWYLDKNLHIIICFEEEKDNWFWFYNPEEDCVLAYCENELKNIVRY